jgi:hypothetical protein
LPEHNAGLALSGSTAQQAVPLFNYLFYSLNINTLLPRITTCRILRQKEVL